MPGWDYERAAAERGYHAVCGCDEAGAGPLAGRVYAAAVMLPDGLELPWLNDSKRVTEDILNSRIKAMQLAIDALEPKADFALIDGNRDHGSKHAITAEHQMVVKGDSLSYSIAAASILAKVSRDRWMVEMAARYPQYEFERHKGYPTKRHFELLRKFGPCPIHRRSFLKNL